MRTYGVAVTGIWSSYAAFPAVLRRQSRCCYSSLSSPSHSPRVSTSSDHVLFIKDIAATQPPQHLPHLLDVLRAKGETIVSPASRKGVIPLAVPLSESQKGTLTALLRWPTSPPDMEMPVVEVRKHGVWLLAKSVDQYIHRILVEEDADSSQESNGKLFNTSSVAGERLYRQGDFVESQIAHIDVYLLKKVGLFPDVLERRVLQHLEKGDFVSAMVAGEFYTKGHFPGFGRPFVCNAGVLSKVGRKLESKDAARVALKSPWWTLGCKYQEIAAIAEWEDEQLEFIKEKVSEEGRKEDLKKGKEPAQVALDQAAFLLDLAAVEGTWSDVVERIAECYKEAGLNDIARFVLYEN